MRVTVKNPLYTELNRYAFTQPKFLTYEGDKVPTPKWAAEGSVALATGNPRWPFRVIDISLIVTIDNNTVAEAKQNSDIKTFTVNGSKGQSYVITIAPSGRTCTCEGYMFRRNCRHLNLVCN